MQNFKMVNMLVCTSFQDSDIMQGVSQNLSVQTFKLSCGINFQNKFLETLSYSGEPQQHSIQREKTGEFSEAKNHLLLVVSICLLFLKTQIISITEGKLTPIKQILQVYICASSYKCRPCSSFTFSFCHEDLTIW